MGELVASALQSSDEDKETNLYDVLSMCPALSAAVH